MYLHAPPSPFASGRCVSPQRQRSNSISMRFFIVRHGLSLASDRCLRRPRPRSGASRGVRRERTCPYSYSPNTHRALLHGEASRPRLVWRDIVSDGFVRFTWIAARQAARHLSGPKAPCCHSTVKTPYINAKAFTFGLQA